MNPSTAYIVLGTVVIAIGGIVATLGWNLRSTQNTRKMLAEARIAEIKTRRQALLSAVVAEVGHNEKTSADPRFTELDDAKLIHFTVYQRFRADALSGVLASGLFLLEDDREFFEAATDLYERIKDFDRRLDTTEDEIRRAPETAQMWRIKLRDSSQFAGLKERLGNMRRLVATNYGSGENWDTSSGD
ncbi:MAG: hypothetical protein QME66_03455 [Candidatus Eisenbacteria bacterium]|nr:hypothetical protein [Candidatus Eisenbacteria bacterium]